MSRVALTPLTEEDREQFIRDNQEAFNYGALEEFGLGADRAALSAGQGLGDDHALF